MKPITCWLIMVVLIGAGDVMPVRGDDRAPGGEVLLPSVEELRASIKQLDAEIAATSAQVRQLDSDQQAKQQQQQNERDKLAGQLLEARFEYEQTVDRIARLKPKADALAEHAKQTDQAVRSVTVAAHDAAERAMVVLTGVPGNAERVERLRTAVQTLAKESGEPTHDALRTVTTELTAAHVDATRVTIQPAEIYTATTRRESVQLISIAMAQFAYVTTADHRVGVALAGPTQASGYRWSEEIDPRVADQIRRVVADADGGADASVTVWLPIDPTGRLQPESMRGAPTLVDRFIAGGPVMYPIALVALLAILLIGERWWVLYLNNRRGDAMARQVALACRAGRFDQAVALAKRAGGVVGRVLAACLNRRDRGQRAMEDSIQEQLLQESPGLHRFMGSIAILAAVAPLLGLLGTVTGIIQTFGVIRAMGSADPSLTAGGISEALITTAAGLIIAVPILIIHSLLRGRSERVLADAERHAAIVLMVLTYDQQGGQTLAAAESEVEADRID